MERHETKVLWDCGRRELFIAAFLSSARILVGCGNMGRAWSRSPGQDRKKNWGEEGRDQAKKRHIKFFSAEDPCAVVFPFLFCWAWQGREMGQYCLDFSRILIVDTEMKQGVEKGLMDVHSLQDWVNILFFGPCFSLAQRSRGLGQTLGIAHTASSGKACWKVDTEKERGLEQDGEKLRYRKRQRLISL